MKYIADYPTDAGSLTRLHGSSGQGVQQISRKKKEKSTNVRDGTRSQWVCPSLTRPEGGQLLGPHVPLTDAATRLPRHSRLPDL